jgi:hypothetical protein
MAPQDIESIIKMLMYVIAYYAIRTVYRWFKR